MRLNLSYKRVLLKISGESLSGEAGFSLDDGVLYGVAKAIGSAYEKGVQIAVVIGGGNFWRGRTGGNITKQTADDIGMLATVMNALAMYDTLLKQDIPVKVLSSLHMPGLCDMFTREAALKHLAKGRVVLFAGGTGSQFFTTDSAAALRAVQIDADILLKATMVDGVYDKDPKVHSDCKRYETLTFTRVLNDGLSVMDSTAATICRDNNLPMRVFSGEVYGNITAAILGENIGTLIS